MEGMIINMRNFYTLSIQEAEKEAMTDIKNGLSEKEAEKRLLKNGKNILIEKKRHSLIMRFFMQFNDFMIILLLIAAAVSYFTSLLEGSGDLVEPVIILAIVILNALLGIIQESRAEKSLEALKKLSTPHSTVIRNGKKINISSADLCFGDIISFSSGDVISADCRLISSNNLIIDESSLTGESSPVEKDSNTVFPEATPLGDRQNTVFSSTSVLSGKGMGIVVKTGMNTEVGEIASMLLTDEAPKTPLQIKLADTGKNLGIAALVICLVVFLIGLFRHLNPLDMFMTSVSLAVAAIPEGLPAIVTIMLAIGVMKMSKENAIVRKLPSVETLGGATVICSDKTGTLTQNKMKVTELYSKDYLTTLRFGALCCSENPNPTDTAVLKKAEDENIDLKTLFEKYELIEEIPFSSQRKRLSVLRKSSKGRWIIIKGAVEYILPLCTRIKTASGVSAISSSDKSKIIKENKKMTDNALRVIAVAYTDNAPDKIKEENLIFAGLLGIEDPPRPEAANSVAVCKSAGIIPVMITGDHAGTAVSIAKKIGILTDEKVMTGAEIDLLSDVGLADVIEQYRVFARVTPTHKVRIVKAWQSKGFVVAMTGDGVNDAPALSCADIGCSMGKSGTEVAKNASDIILTDDNFATIVSAVKVGRGIFDNIKKSVKFLLSSNIGEILTVFCGIILSGTSPLSAIELLWVNLVTDSLPAIALGLDPNDGNIMQKPPKANAKKLFSGGLWGDIVFEGMMIGSLALLAFSIGKNIFNDIIIGQTMAFAVLSISQLVHAFNMRSEESVIKSGLFKNKYLVLSFIAGLILEVSVISIAPIASIFGVVQLSVLQWTITAGLSALPLIIVELQKAAKKLTH